MSGSNRRAVFLDRDGVINQAITRDGTPFPPATWEEVRIPEDVPLALNALKHAGFLLLVATNQPDVARGTQHKEEVERIHSELMLRLPLDEIWVCYHDDSDDCTCRKPKPGLLLQASSKLSIDLRSSFVVGDRWKDIEAGRNAGCKTVFIDRGYSEARPSPPADLTVSSLAEAIPWILKHIEEGA